MVEDYRNKRLKILLTTLQSNSRNSDSFIYRTLNQRRDEIVFVFG